MQHAEAHERLSDLALDPGRLARIETDPSPEAAALREHVAGCQRCVADLAGWRRTWAETATALRGADPIDEIRAPADLRARTLAAVHAAARAGAVAIESNRPESAASRIGRPASPGPGRRRRPGPRVAWLLAAAALVVAVVGGSVGLARSADVGRLQAETARLEAVAATFDRVLAAPQHWTVTLRTADGTAAGTMAWSAAEIVVVTTGLPAPGDGQTYRCWVEVDGTRTPMGSMAFAGATGYWVGSMYQWSESIGPGARYGVSLVPETGVATPVLVGTL
jgi:hypothetical protein